MVLTFESYSILSIAVVQHCFLEFNNVWDIYYKYGFKVAFGREGWE